MKSKVSIEPWKPVAMEPADVIALQALVQGQATELQQKRAIDWIIKVAAGTYEPSYRDGADGDRNTAFAEGRRFVGLSIVKATVLNASRMRRVENEE